MFDYVDVAALHHYDVIVTNNRTCEAVVAGIVTKCLNARPKTKQGGIDVCLMYTEIEQQAVVQVTVTMTICV